MSARRGHAFEKARQTHEDSDTEVSEDGHFGQGSGDLEDEFSPRSGRELPGSIMRSKLFGDLDLDSNGRISREEWMAAFARIADQKRGGDPQGGVITRKEWALRGGQTYVFDAITGKRKFATIGLSDWRRAFDRLDQDKDGSITLKEWLDLAAGPKSAMYVGHNYAFKGDVQNVKRMVAVTRAFSPPKAQTSPRAQPSPRGQLAHVSGIVARPSVSREPPAWRNKIDVERAQAQLASLDQIMQDHKWALRELEDEGARREVMFNQEVERLTEECEHWGGLALRTKALAKAEETQIDEDIAAVQLRLADIRSRERRLEHMLRGFSCEHDEHGEGWSF